MNKTWMLQGFSYSLVVLVVWQVYLASQEVNQMVCLDQVEEVEAALDVPPENDELEACHEELHGPHWLSSCFRKFGDVNWELYQHIF